MAMMTSGKLTGTKGLVLYYELWEPSTPPRALVALAHGYAEHIGRYRHVIEALVAHGYVVAALDHHGHGQSEGPRAVTQDFDRYIQDFHHLVERVRADVPTLHLVVMGHSMGGLIAVRYTLAHQPTVAALVVSGAALQVGEETSPLLKKVSGLLARLIPNVPLLPHQNHELSRDPAIFDHFMSDPLNYTGRVKTALAYQLLSTSDATRRQLGALTVPMLIMHGTDDRLTAPSGSQRLYEMARSEDKTLRMWQDNFHEIFNELDQDNVLATLVHWLNQRFPAPGA